MEVTQRALEVLEFDRVLDRVAVRAATVEGQARVRSLRPRHDRTAIVAELARVGAVLRFIDRDPSWGMVAVPDIRGALSQLSVDGAVLEGPRVHAIGVVLQASRRLHADLGSQQESFPELDSLRAALLDERSVEKSIERTVDDDGQVLDGASGELRRIRDRLRGAHSRVVRQLEQYLRGVSDRFQVADGSVTIRDGRYVIPVRREGKGEVGGIVHDESQSGATLFVEPPMAIEMMNAVRELEREEAREVHRILRDLTRELAPHQHALAGSVDALADFDSLHARARAAMAWDAEMPVFCEEGDRQLRLRGVRHPLLLSGTLDVVPYDLDLEHEERALVVSGPNTGGKSVFLKATGLVCALAQSGVIPPCEAGTRLPVFRAFFADIGDEQSIAHSLSTFSAHLTNLSAIVETADGESLVLIDEMGTGTDPAEGAALSRAVLEELVGAGATTIASSHLGELKRLDVAGSGIVNASLQFDSERMEPTYRLVKGRPGRSYGLAIARRMGLPSGVLDRAESYREDGEARMEDLLARLEVQEREAARLLEALDGEKAEAERLRVELQDRERTLRSAERDAGEQAKAEARKLLMEARAEVDAAIREVRVTADSKDDLEAAAHDARSRVEKAANRLRDRSRTSRPSGGGPELKAGDRVKMHATGAKGSVTEVRGDRVLVEMGALRMEVDRADLEPIDSPSATPGRTVQRGGWRGPDKDQQARTEVDLRGLRVSELELALGRALDSAVFEDLAEVRIIHGKGTGALRQRVTEVLKTDGRVRSFRMGGPMEGGAGVTVVSFRGVTST